MPSTRIGSQLVAGGGHQLGLGALAADEDDLGALSPQRVGDRDAPAPRAPLSRRLRSRSAVRSSRPPAADRAQVRRPAAGDVQQQPHRAQQHDQRRRAGGDERQRHAGQRREAEDGEDVQQRLAQDQRGQARRRAASRRRPWPPSRCAARRRRSCRTGTSSAQIPATPELLADHREDEVGVGLGQVEDLLHRLARARRRTGRPSRSRSAPAPTGSRSSPASVPRVQERGQAVAPVGLEQREQDDGERRDADRKPPAGAAAGPRRPASRRA